MGVYSDSNIYRWEERTSEGDDRVWSGEPKNERSQLVDHKQKRKKLDVRLR